MYQAVNTFDTHRVFCHDAMLCQNEAMNNLARYRELRGLSQRDLAEMLGVSQPTVQRAEREDPTAKLGTYKRCAEVLGVTLSDIFADRSSLEDRLIWMFRKIPEQKHSQILQILELAREIPDEAVEEANKAVSG